MELGLIRRVEREASTEMPGVKLVTLHMAWGPSTAQARRICGTLASLRMTTLY
jgi:hypothetical protein